MRKTWGLEEQGTSQDPSGGQYKRDKEGCPTKLRKVNIVPSKSIQPMTIPKESQHSMG